MFFLWEFDCERRKEAWDVRSEFLRVRKRAASRSTFVRRSALLILPSMCCMSMEAYSCWHSGIKCSRMLRYLSPFVVVVFDQSAQERLSL